MAKEAPLVRRRRIKYYLRTMKNLLSAVLFFTASVLSAIAQNNVLYLSTYLKENAIRVADPGQLSDSVYTLL